MRSTAPRSLSCGDQPELGAGGFCSGLAICYGNLRSDLRRPTEPGPRALPCLGTWKPFLSGPELTRLPGSGRLSGVPPSTKRFSKGYPLTICLHTPGKMVRVR